MKKNIIIKSLLIYLLMTAEFSAMILFGIQALKNAGTGQFPAYIIAAGTGLFILLAAAVILLYNEGRSIKGIFIRARLSRLTKNDLLAVLIGITSILVLDGVLFGTEKIILKQYSADLAFSKLPDFTGMTGNLRGEFAIIPVYIIYLFFNIFGEELLWRGYLLTAQEKAIGKYAWIFNGIFWLIFHWTFGISVIMMIPLLFILPYLVQRQKNTWVGIIIHSITGCIGFISVLNGII